MLISDFLSSMTLICDEKYQPPAEIKKTWSAGSGNESQARLQLREKLPSSCCDARNLSTCFFFQVYCFSTCFFSSVFFHVCLWMLPVTNREMVLLGEEVGEGVGEQGPDP